MVRDFVLRLSPVVGTTSSARAWLRERSMLSSAWAPTEKQVEVFRVPGAFEIPLLALRLAESEKFDAIICIGTIIRGQTPHFEYIAAEVTRGIGEAGLQTGVPVVYGVVTADTVDQAIDRAGVKLGNKGFEAATTAVELVNLYKTV